MRTILPLAALGTLAACLPVTTQSTNDNNGALKELTFAGPAGPVAVGAPAAVTVSRRNVGESECYPRNEYDFSADSAPCRFLGTPTSLRQVTAASCSGGCEVVQVGNAGLVVTARSAGTKKVEVTAELDDGTRHTDQLELVFAAADRIEVLCAASGLCPGRHAVLVGASFQWDPAAWAGDTLLGGTVEVTVSPAGVVALDGPVVRALAPGVAQVTHRVGALSRVLTVRVAALDDIVAGDIHGTVPGYNPNRRLDAATEVVGPLYSAAYNFGDHIPVWTLKDGTTALGLAHRATAEGAQVLTEVFGVAPEGRLYFKAGQSSGCTPGRFTVEVDAGSAKARRSFDLLCG